MRTFSIPKIFQAFLSGGLFMHRYRRQLAFRRTRTGFNSKHFFKAIHWQIDRHFSWGFLMRLNKTSTIKSGDALKTVVQKRVEISILRNQQKNTMSSLQGTVNQIIAG